jgi:HK97 family phage major capsid protein/HK97 family phage prohead protease
MNAPVVNATRKAPTTLKPGTKLERGFAVVRSSVNEEARTVELSFASECPYERWWGIEILDCTPTAMRMGRLTSGGPLLCDHDTRDVIGVIESVQLGADRVARAVVRFGKSERAEEVFRDVVDGIRRNVSVGYQIHQAVLVETNDDQDTYRVTDWEPYEVSLVSVPADASVGVGRSAQGDSPVITTTPPTFTQKDSTVTTATPEIVATPAASPAAPSIGSQDVRAMENNMRKQFQEMTAIGEQFARFNGVALAKEAIEKGQTVDQLRGLVMNAMTASQTTQVTNLDLSKADQKRFSVFKAIRALTDKTWKGAEFELECHNEILKRTGLPEAVHGGFYMPMDVQKRDLTVGTASAGGNLVATNLLDSNFIDLLRARSRAAQLGATLLPGLVGNVAIPKLTGASTAYWLTNEATAITESQQTFGQLALAPKNLGAYTEISRQLMLQSTPAAEQLVMNDLAKVLALAIDLAAFEGSGSAGQPTGISATAGIGAVTGTSIALAGIVEFQTDTGAANALSPNSAYLTTPTVAGLLMQRQRFSSTDTPLWTGSVLDGQMCGYTASTTTAITAASMIFGDFSQVVIGEWGMLEIALNPYANFSAAITGIRAIQSVDVGIRQAAAFSRATSIT